MRKSLSSLSALAALTLAMAASASTPVNKCIVNGAITFQESPCPATGVYKRPTIDELNAQEKKRRAAAAAARKAAPVASRSAGPFSCDGRTLCSQMTSCAEAEYFLAKCPGVKMDGDHNRIPCEKQWCTR